MIFSGPGIHFSSLLPPEVSSHLQDKTEAPFGDGHHRPQNKDARNTLWRHHHKLTSWYRNDAVQSLSLASPEQDHCPVYIF